MKKGRRKTITPEWEIDVTLLAKIAYEVWPKENFNTIKGIHDCKLYYNTAYNRLLNELNILLDRYHPASWVREAYIQLEIWTFLFYAPTHKKKLYKTSDPINLAPIGRYGWRYVLEICLEKMHEDPKHNSDRPTKKDLSKVFTLLVALSHTSEFSNYLHYFNLQLSSVQLKFSPFILVHPPHFDGNDSLFFANLIKYIGEKPDLKKYHQFEVKNNKKIMQMIDEMLLRYFGFSLLEITHLVNVFAVRISNDLGASILVTTYEEAILVLSKYSSLHIAKVKSILDFILLNVKSNTYQKRDFLNKSQTDRMLNYGGAILYLKDNFRTIYDSNAALYDFVVSSKSHIVLTPTLLAEWIDVFPARLVYGQRTDLKGIHEEINQKISVIEEFFHRNLFETELKSLLSQKGYLCISINKIDGVQIECGEIDIVAYHPSNNILLIVEAKCHAPAPDARSMGRVISDHFKQKKYHSKFFKKINWVKNNSDRISKLFNLRFAHKMQQDYEIRCYFVTGSPNAVKFLVKDYEVLTFSEFDMIL